MYQETIFKNKNYYSYNAWTPTSTIYNKTQFKVFNDLFYCYLCILYFHKLKISFSYLQIQLCSIANRARGSTSWKSRANRSCHLRTFQIIKVSRFCCNTGKQHKRNLDKLGTELKWYTFWSIFTIVVCANRTIYIYIYIHWSLLQNTIAWKYLCFKI